MEELNIKQKLDLLSRTIWTNQDIMAYTGCAATKAVEIHHKAAIEHNGLIKLLPKRIKRDAVLNSLGLSFEEELENITQILEIQKKELELKHEN